MARPTSYDKEAVMSEALEQFWADGFNRSSVDVIVDKTGLNKHSLYQSFGGKSGLFFRVLQRYLEQYSLRYLEIFERQQGLAALRGYFQAVLREPDRRGCLVANTAIELGDSDSDCHRLITEYYDRLADCFADAIKQGQRDSSIRADLHPRDTAIWLVRSVQGLAVDSRLRSLHAPTMKTMLALLTNPTNKSQSH